MTALPTSAIFARTKSIVNCIYKHNSIQQNRTYKRFFTVQKKLPHQCLWFPTIRYCTKRFIMTIDYDCFTSVKKIPINVRYNES